VINPTNGSSYTGEILQQQQVATSQLRAIESGRFLVQAATTGYSLVINPDGKVLRSLSIGEQGVIVENVALRTGRTVYSYVGDMGIALALAFISLAAARRGRR
jgi:apolipoprotein N-acyltransferase